MAEEDAIREQLTSSAEEISRLNLECVDGDAASRAFDVFRLALSRAARRRMVGMEGWLEAVEAKQVIWAFLVRLHERKKIYRPQITAVSAILLNVPSWHQALTQEFALCDSLPEDIKALLNKGGLSATSHVDSQSANADASTASAAVLDPISSTSEVHLRSTQSDAGSHGSASSASAVLPPPNRRQSEAAFLTSSADEHVSCRSQWSVAVGDELQNRTQRDTAALEPLESFLGMPSSHEWASLPSSLVTPTKSKDSGFDFVRPSGTSSSSSALGRAASSGRVSKGEHPAFELVNLGLGLFSDVKAAGRVARGGNAGGGYHFGDFSRGIVSKLSGIDGAQQRQGNVGETQALIVPPPSGCSLQELAEHLRRIRWRLDAAAFGDLRHQEREVPRLVEAIRVSTEWLVWGERNEAQLIELFRRHTMLEGLVVAMRTDATPEAVKVQAMQTISIVASQVRSPASTAYFFSVLNPFFETPPDLSHEEIQAYFVTLLKSLALRLDGGNVQYCLVVIDESGASCSQEAAYRMPVLDCAVQLVGHQETMVQAAARTAVLAILRLEHPSVRPMAELVASRRLAPILASLASEAAHAARTSPDEKMQDLAECFEDLLRFVEDLNRLNIPLVTQALEHEGFVTDAKGAVTFADCGLVW